MFAICREEENKSMTTLSRGCETAKIPAKGVSMQCLKKVKTSYENVRGVLALGGNGGYQSARNIEADINASAA